MRAASQKLILGAFTLGLAVVAAADAVRADDNAVLQGPAAAIAKARAAAAKADQRTNATNEQSAATVTGPRTPVEPVVPEAAASKSGERNAEAANEAQGAEGEVQASYDPKAHRDPFVPMLLKAVAAARTPLETYQLGQLKLVGIVAQPEEGYRAMVEDSSGLGYIITTGTPIGSSGGVVRSIEPRRVVIEESTRDFYGDVKPKEVVMELPQEDRSP